LIKSGRCDGPVEWPVTTVKGNEQLSEELEVVNLEMGWGYCQFYLKSR